ncbi:sensory box/GGDEF family protein [Vibrio sinaloensis DSM 21326]|uniref:Sensory box/GGDEF family protein n=1 Tax=Vibrio sinaloensis DSM 21326 TaxID=945550 RepID=E8M735_PHOS4|nr:EAL domain-containing protein [Vibrio sinaloensis]EGA70234.1 sensory box/GGDEF family protein [Vibrio sinaloensis DSM 21326]
MRQLGFKSHLIFATACVVTLVCALNFILYSAAYEQQSDEIYEKIALSVEQSLEKKVEDQAISLAKTLSNQAFNPLYHYNVSSALHLLQSNLSQPNIESIYIIDKEGLIFHDGTNDIVSFGEPHAKSDLIRQVLNTQKIVKENQENHLYVAAPISEGDKHLGVLFIEMNTHKLTAELKNNKQHLVAMGELDSERMRRWQLIFSAVGVICGVAMAYSVGNSFANPISQISSQLKQTKDGRFSLVVDEVRYRELRQLVGAFNGMQKSVNDHNARIEHMAFHDQLTGLPNRFRFIESVDKQMNSNNNQLIAILFIDLDDFKFINDNFGHHVGDEVIMQVCQRIEQVVSSQEFANVTAPCVLSRVGGDEFMLMVPYSAEMRVSAIADAILKAVIQPIDHQQSKLSCSASIGIACYPDFGSDAESLCRHAELAMFERKQKGKNAYTIYTHSMDKTIQERLYIERELRRAMDDLSQFELWYQPKFDVATSRIIGAEALVRWNHPTQGYIRPDKFIPVAESTDLILTLGEHLIKLAAKQASIWVKQYGEEFYIALNLSPRQLYRQNLVEIFATSLEQNQLHANALHVEVTETLLMSDSAKIKAVLHNLRKMGIQVWLDDFGTGYSSLSYLQEYQFDGVKIDRSFIYTLSSENNNTSLIEAILSIASSMKMMSVAEGIETDYQLARLKQLGCQYGQGYLISRPLPAAEFVEMQTQLAANSY